MNRIRPKNQEVLVHEDVREHAGIRIIFWYLRHVKELKHTEPEDHDEQNKQERSQLPDHINEILTHCSRLLEQA